MSAEMLSFRDSRRIFRTSASNRRKTVDTASVNMQGPELIQAGTAAAFGVGKGNSAQDKVQLDIKKSSEGTYQEIKTLAANVAAGLKVNIRNIEAFAP